MAFTKRDTDDLDSGISTLLYICHSEPSYSL